MAEQILVYRTWEDWGFQCQHAGCNPHTEDDIVLCEACADKYEAGAEILKLPLPRTEALARIAHIRVGERILFDIHHLESFIAAQKIRAQA